MGRPKLDRVRLNITLPPMLVAEIDGIAASTGRTRSDVIQEASEALMRRLDARPKKKAKP